MAGIGFFDMLLGGGGGGAQGTTNAPPPRPSLIIDETRADLERRIMEEERRVQSLQSEVDNLTNRALIAKRNGNEELVMSLLDSLEVKEEDLRDAQAAIAQHRDRLKLVVNATRIAEQNETDAKLSAAMRQIKPQLDVEKARDIQEELVSQSRDIEEIKKTRNTRITRPTISREEARMTERERREARLARLDARSTAAQERSADALLQTLEPVPASSPVAAPARSSPTMFSSMARRMNASSSSYKQ